MPNKGCGVGGPLKYCHSAKPQMLIFKFHINLMLLFSHSLEFLEGFPATSHILLSTLKLLQLPDTMPTPGGIDVTHSSKGCLHPACHLFQEHFKVGHFLLIDDNTAPREERVPVAIHQHALHHRLREPRPLCASTSHARWLRTFCAAQATPTRCLHLLTQERVPASATLSPPPWRLPARGEALTHTHAEPWAPRPTSREAEEGAWRRGEGLQPPRVLRHSSARPFESGSS